MDQSKDDSRLLLFTCERCGHWPLAFQGTRPFGGETSFSCPRCKQASIFKIRKEGDRPLRLESLAR